MVAYIITIFQEIIKALLKVEDVNVFAVDWSSGAAFKTGRTLDGFDIYGGVLETLYFQAASNARVVGAEIKRLILYLVNMFVISRSK